MARTRFSVADAAVIVGLMFFYYLATYFTLPSDALMAWPITDSLMHPDHYSSSDLLVSSGTKGNYLLYSWLALVPFLRDNLPLRDFLFYLPIFFLYLAAWWKVFA